MVKMRDRDDDGWRPHQDDKYPQAGSFSWDPNRVPQDCIDDLTKFLEWRRSADVTDVAKKLTDKQQRDNNELLDRLIRIRRSAHSSAALVLQLVISVCILCSVVGYIGCFSLVQNSGSSLFGPLLWLGLESLLSIVRMVDAPPLKLAVERNRHAPLVTTDIDAEQIAVDKALPLVREKEFLEDIARYTGPLERCKLEPNQVLFYSFVGSQSHDTAEKLLYITLSDSTRRTALVLVPPRSNLQHENDPITIHEATLDSDDMYADVGNNILESHPRVRNNRATLDSVLVHHRVITNKIAQRSARPPGGRTSWHDNYVFYRIPFISQASSDSLDFQSTSIGYRDTSSQWLRSILAKGSRKSHGPILPTFHAPSPPPSWHIAEWLADVLASAIYATEQKKVASPIGLTEADKQYLLLGRQAVSKSKFTHKRGEEVENSAILDIGRVPVASSDSHNDEDPDLKQIRVTNALDELLDKWMDREIVLLEESIMLEEITHKRWIKLVDDLKLKERYGTHYVERLLDVRIATARKRLGNENEKKDERVKKVHSGAINVGVQLGHSWDDARKWLEQTWTEKINSFPRCNGNSEIISRSFDLPSAKESPIRKDYYFKMGQKESVDAQDDADRRRANQRLGQISKAKALEDGVEVYKKFLSEPEADQATKAQDSRGAGEGLNRGVPVPDRQSRAMSIFTTY
jgi:hypothetical protein